MSRPLAYERRNRAESADKGRPTQAMRRQKPSHLLVWTQNGKGNWSRTLGGLRLTVFRLHHEDHWRWVRGKARPLGRFGRPAPPFGKDSCFSTELYQTAEDAMAAAVPPEIGVREP